MPNLPFQPFIRHLQDNDRSHNTVTGYLADLADFARWFEATNGEQLTPAAITPTDVRAYRQHLLVSRKLSPNTINRRLSAVSAYCRWAMEARLIESGPTARIRPVQLVSHGPRWLDRKQRFALQRVIEQERQMAAAHPDRRRSLWRARGAVIMSVLLNTGLRVAELGLLDVQDAKLKPRSGQVTVRGKGNKVRTVPLNAAARESISHWLGLRPEVEDAALFISQLLARITTRSIERVVAEYGHAARLERLTPHMLRHTFAKTLVDKGVSIDQVATLLGHASLNTTRIYTTPGQRDLEQAVELIGEV